MSVEVQRVDTPAKRLEVARFTPETLATATSGRKSFACGWKKRPRIDRNTHIIIECNFGDGYKVVGDGWAKTPAHENDDRFGEDYPFTVRLDGVRIIADPENFIDSPLSWPARSVSMEHDGQTFVNASRTVVELDYLWSEGLTDDIKVIKDWDM